MKINLPFHVRCACLEIKMDIFVKFKILPCIQINTEFEISDVYLPVTTNGTEHCRQLDGFVSFITRTEQVK